MAEQIIQDGIIVGRASGPTITVVPTTDGISTIIFDDRSGGETSEIEFDHGANTFKVSIGGVTQLLATSTGITVGGDFHVDGTTTTTDSVDLVVSDNVITLNSGEGGAGVGNGTGVSGIEIDRGTLDNAGWFYNETYNWWGPTGPSGTFGVGVGATQSIGNITTIDFTGATEQILVIDSTGGLQLPAGTTAERPTVGVIDSGLIRFNKSTDLLEAWNGTEWGQFVVTIPGTTVTVTGDLNFSDTYSLINPSDPTTGDEVGDRDYNDARYLQIANNLSDITNPALARSNLGLSATALDAVERSGDSMYGPLVMGDGGVIDVTASSINNGGTGYAVDDIVTIAGGTYTSPLQIKVITIGGSGEILTYVQEHNGVYSVAPTSPASTTGGTGAGATFNITTSTPELNILPYEDYTTSVIPCDIGKTNGIDGYVGSDLRFRSIHAETFHGLATSALYADLAERYEADAIYDEGTVVIFGGEKEITSTDTAANTSVAGVISTKPAFKMNRGAGTSKTHPYVALKGKVPCKVVGKVRKGDLMVTSEKRGYGMSGGFRVEPYSAFARALENHDSDGEGIIYVSII